MNKEQRQRRIQEIIARESVATQTELVERLRNEGVWVTQATVSRDINELRLVRLPVGKNQHRYSLAQLQDTTRAMDELGRLFSTLVLDVDRGENLLVIKTAHGHASGVAFLIDKLKRDDIVGTVAGQNTILLIARTAAEGEALVEELSSLMLG